MIRIDVGKDELSKPAPRSMSGILKGLKTPIRISPNSKLHALTSDVAMLTTFAVVVVFSVLPLVFVSQYKGFVESQHARSLQQLQTEVATLDHEIERLRPFQKELESYEGQKKLVSERLAVVNTLLASRSAPVQVLDAIGQSVPARLWLTTIEFKVSERPGQIQLVGSSYSHEEISDFAEKLSDSVYLADVTMGDVQSATTNGLDIKNFSVKLAPKDAYSARDITAQRGALTPPGAPTASP